MRILMTNLFLDKNTGTESYLYTLAHFLKKEWNDVSLYTFYGWDLSKKMEKEWFKIFYHPLHNWFLHYRKNIFSKTIKKIFWLFCILFKKFLWFDFYVPFKIPETDFDIIHYQHSSVIKTIYKRLSHIPKVHLIHWILPSEEQPLSYSKYPMNNYIAISNEIKNHLLDFGIPNEKINIVYNPIDVDLFLNCSHESNLIPKKILIISKKIAAIPKMLNKIENACKKKNIKLTIIGHPYNIVKDTKPFIENSDIVVWIGRCAYEAMSMGKNVIVCDYLWLEWMIDSEKTFLKFRENNMSWRYRNNKEFSTDDFVREIEKYSSSNWELTRSLIIKHQSMEKIWLHIISLYKNTIKLR